MPGKINDKWYNNLSPERKEDLYKLFLKDDSKVWGTEGPDLFTSPGRWWEKEDKAEFIKRYENERI